MPRRLRECIGCIPRPSSLHEAQPTDREEDRQFLGSRKRFQITFSLHFGIGYLEGPSLVVMVLETVQTLIRHFGVESLGGAFPAQEEMPLGRDQLQRVAQPPSQRGVENGNGTARAHSISGQKPVEKDIA